MTYDRIQQIKNHEKYITKVSAVSLYGMNKHTIRVKKNIPISLTEEDLVMYADNWNGCFGGTVTKYEKDANYWEYIVCVYTD